MKKMLALVLAALMLLSIVACGQNADGTDNEAANGQNAATDGTTPTVPDEPDDSTEYKDAIVIGVTGAPEVMDPQEVKKTVDYMAQRLTHDTLFRIDESTGELIPWLCESWEIDGEKWTIHLRQDVKFSDGSDFTADDVEYTFTRGLESSQIASYCEKIASMNVIDPYTIEISWITVNVDMGALFTNVKYSMLSKSACEADPEEGYLVGTGAYTLKELFDNSYAIFEKNEYYWGEPVISQSIEFRYMAEASARLIALQNGEIDMCISPATTELAYVEEDDNLELLQVPGASTIYLAFNMNKEPFDNVAFRQAVAYAINVEDLIAIVLDGVGSEGKSTIGPNNAVNCDDALTGYPYDPEKAKEILDTNGWSGMTIELYCADSGNNYRTAESLQAQLGEVGLDIHINNLASTELNAATKAGEHDLYVASISVSDYADAVRTQLYTGSGYNYSFFSDEEVDQWIDEGVAIQDFAERKALYTEMQQKVFDEMVYLYPMMRANSAVAQVKGFGGYYLRSDLILDLTHAFVPVQ